MNITTGVAMLLISRAYIFAIANALAALPPTLVFAEANHWKNVGSWDISFYEGVGGCVASIAYESGQAFFIGLGSHKGEISLEMTLMSEDWKSIEDGKEYAVSVAFGNEGPWDLEMRGVKLETYWGMEFSAPATTDIAGQFVEEFMDEVGMEWSYRGQSLGNLSLRGSRESFMEAVACTKSYRDAVGNSADPFSSSGATPNDPFAN